MLNSLVLNIQDNRKITRMADLFNGIHNFSLFIVIAIVKKKYLFSIFVFAFDKDYNNKYY